MEPTQSNPDTSTKKTGSTGRIVLGLLFLLPALFCCVTQLLLPTIGTFGMSFQKINLLGPENVFIGMQNYVRLFGDERFQQATGFTFTTLFVRLFVVALVPLCLAWAAGQVGRPLRLGLRILSSLPIVLFAPAAIAAAWLLFLNPVNGGFSFGMEWAARPESARSMLLFIDALYVFGLASGLGLMVFLPLWRRPAGTPAPTLREVWKPMLATWALGILGVSVLTLSTFSLNFVLTNGGPLGSTNTLALLLYQYAFLRFQIGPAAAIASLILLLTLALGSLAGLLVILSRLRLDLIVAKPAPEKASGSILARLVFALLALLTVGVCLFSVLPFGALLPQAFGRDGLGRLLEQVHAGQIFINTFVPALVAATLQVLLAYLAALGIGALRPFGKRSTWLLLLFSPWLFIGVLPLSLVNFIAVQKAEMIDTFSASLSPIVFSIPALFVLTLFFAGRASRQDGTTEAAPDFFRNFVLPSLPLAAVLWLVLLFFNGQDVFWSLLVSMSPERYTLNVALIRLIGMFNTANGMLAAAVVIFILPVCVFFFICLALFQVFYLDRLTLYAEEPAAGKVARDPG